MIDDLYKNVCLQIERRLASIQNKHNFNPFMGKKQIKNREDQAYDYGRFVALKELAKTLGIEVPYDPSGSGHAPQRLVLRVKCYVYFIHQIGTSIWKIGSSANPHNRLQTIKGDNPYDLCLKYLAPGGLQEEYTVHQVLKKHRYNKRNEWFDISDEKIIKAIIKKLSEHG